MREKVAKREAEKAEAAKAKRGRSRSRSPSHRGRSRSLSPPKRSEANPPELRALRAEPISMEEMEGGPQHGPWPKPANYKEPPGNQEEVIPPSIHDEQEPEVKLVILQPNKRYRVIVQQMERAEACVLEFPGVPGQPQTVEWDAAWFKNK